MAQDTQRLGMKTEDLKSVNFSVSAEKPDGTVINYRLSAKSAYKRAKKLKANYVTMTAGSHNGKMFHFFSFGDPSQSRRQVYHHVPVGVATRIPLYKPRKVVARRNAVDEREDAQEEEGSNENEPDNSE